MAGRLQTDWSRQRRDCCVPRSSCWPGLRPGVIVLTAYDSRLTAHDSQLTTHEPSILRYAASCASVLRLPRDTATPILRVTVGCGRWANCGRDFRSRIVCRGYFALTGLDWYLRGIPGALPRAVIYRPFRPFNIYQFTIKFVGIPSIHNYSIISQNLKTAPQEQLS